MQNCIAAAAQTWLVLLLNTVWACRAMKSHASRNAGWPGAPANTHCKICRRRQMRTADI